MSPSPLHVVDPLPADGPEDLLGLWMDYVDSVPTPDCFRRWAGISLIAGCLERRCWIKTGALRSYASLYILLVAMPGIGKKIIDYVEDLWSNVLDPLGGSAKALRVAPHNVTKAALIDALAKAKQVRVPPWGQAMTYHSLNVAAEEFGVLLPSYDPDFINVFNKMWNNPKLYREERRTGTVKELSIEEPQINLIGGYQPALMAMTFPEEAWTSGWGRRLLMVYAGERVYRDIFDEAPDLDLQRRELLRRLGQLTQLFGEYDWEPEAKNYLRDWDKRGGPPSPTHGKLETYCQSRTELVVRLCLTSAVSRGEGLGGGSRLIRLLDVQRCIHWLLEAERSMPDIFQAMTGKSDSQVLEELHWYVMAKYGERKSRAVPRQMVIRFLATRVPSDKIERVLGAAIGGGYIDRVASTGGPTGNDESAEYVPVARDAWGVR